MEKQVFLTLSGRQQWPDGEESSTQLRTQAQYYERDGALYLLYEERTEDGSPVRSRIKYREPLLELTKTGALKTRMIFEPGREHMTDYATPLGLLRFGIQTSAIEAVRQEGRMTIQISYLLTDCGEPVSSCNIVIIIQNNG